MKIKIQYSLFLLFFFIYTSSNAEDVTVPIDKSQSGNLYVNAVINSDIHSQFMVDTGAGMITLNRELFKEIARTGKVEKVGEIVARLANSRLETLTLYKVESFSIGENCNLGEMEVAVMNRSKRNILGLNALIMAAPFSISVSPLELVLSGCSSSNESVSITQQTNSSI